MGGLLSKNSPGAQTSQEQSVKEDIQKKVVAEAISKNADDGSDAGSGAEISKTVEQETESKQPAASSDEKTVEVVETATEKQTTGSAVPPVEHTPAAEPKHVETATGQTENVTEAHEKLTATDKTPDVPAAEVDKTARNLSDETKPETSGVTSDVDIELEKKMEELHVTPDTLPADDQHETKEETEPLPTVDAPKHDEAVVGTAQESHGADPASHVTDKIVAPSGADEQRAVDEHVSSNELAVKQDNEGHEVRHDE